MNTTLEQERRNQDWVRTRIGFAKSCGRTSVDFFSPAENECFTVSFMQKLIDDGYKVYQRPFLCDFPYPRYSVSWCNHDDDDRYADCYRVTFNVKHDVQSACHWTRETYLGAALLIFGIIVLISAIVCH